MKPFAIVFATAVFLALLPGSPLKHVPGGQIYTAHYENVLGTSFELKVMADSEASADRAEAAALDEIDRQARILSAWDARSEFSTWTRTAGAPVPVSPELLEVLGLFDRWRQRTGGALDAAAEAVTQVWKRAEAERRLPRPAELAAAVAQVKQPHWRLDTAHATATHLDRTPLALNSFTKSFIAGRAADAVLASEGVTAAVVNIGGDLVVRGAWTEPVRIADPRSDAENALPLDRLSIRDRAVATSGSYRRGFDIGGHHYSHIVDPRTGQPVDHVLGATVVARDPATAGALATAMCVLQPEESRRLADNMPGVEYLLALDDGTRLTSRGWNRLRIAAMPVAAAPEPPAEAGLWNTAFELTVNLEISHLQDASARRPYVAVWIEDADKYPLRTLALWFDRVRWLPELKAWYHDDRLRSMAEGNDITGSLSSATRPPGKYKVKWDGKDNKGALVKAGKYTVCIEASREHGTYRMLRREIDFNGKEQEIPLQAATELAAISLEYRKK